MELIAHPGCSRRYTSSSGQSWKRTGYPWMWLDKLGAGLCKSKFDSWCNGRDVVPDIRNGLLPQDRPCKWLDESISRADSLAKMKPWRWTILENLTRHDKHTVILLHWEVFFGPRRRECDNSYDLMVSLCFVVQASKMAHDGTITGHRLVWVIVEARCKDGCRLSDGAGVSFGECRDLFYFPYNLQHELYSLHSQSQTEA